MIDMSVMLFSTIMVIFVIVRAIELSKRLPWFSNVKHNELANKKRPLSTSDRRWDHSGGAAGRAVTGVASRDDADD